MIKQETDQLPGPDSLERLLRIHSPPRTLPGQGGGISPLDLLDLPSELQQVMNFLMREGPSSASEIVEGTEIGSDKIVELVDTLVARGHIRRIGQGTGGKYEPILGRSRRPRLSSRLWEMLEEES